jgi:hypothetical protein
MDQFSRWSGIVHSLISKHTPKIKLGQVHQLLAACLGHRTYASLRATDLEILNQKPHYVLFDDGAGLARAMDFGLFVSVEQHGEPRTRDPNEYEDDVEFYWMSED